MGTINDYYKPLGSDRDYPARIIVRESDGESFERLHWHREIELFYVLRGQVTFMKRGSCRTLGDGDLILFNTEEVHRVDKKKNVALRFMLVHLSYGYAKKYDPAPDPLYFELNPEAERELKTMLDGLAERIARGGDRYIAFEKNAVAMRVYHVLLSACRVSGNAAAPAVSRGGEYGGVRIRSMIDYVSAHYREELTRDKLAALAGLTPAYFSQYFREATGMTFSRYLCAVRLEHALSDLVNADRTVVEAALNNGFPNEKAFAAACRRTYGMTPARFKKSLTDDDIENE